MRDAPPPDATQHRDGDAAARQSASEREVIRTVRKVHPGADFAAVDGLDLTRDSAYVADITDLEACSALGVSAEETLAEVERAKRAWLAAAEEAGRPIPKPRYGPAIYTR